MRPAGKLFAIAAILALLVGVLHWPDWEKGGYVFTMGRGGTPGHDARVAVASEYSAFCAGAIFAVFAVIYYWFPILFSRSLSERVSQLHFWISTLAAFAFLFAPVVPTLFKGRSERTLSTTVLIIAVLSSLFFLIAQVVFAVGLSWSATHGKK